MEFEKKENSILINMQDQTSTKVDDPTRKLTYFLFVIYMIGLAWLIVLKFNVAFLWIWKERSYSFIPFEAVFSGGRVDYLEMILNALVFIPVGIYTGALFRNWTIGRHAFFFLGFSMTCELLQYILGVGAADITDVINNTAGGLTGLLAFKGMERLWGTSFKAQKLVNIIATIATIVIVILLVLLRIKELWLFRMYTIGR